MSDLIIQYDIEVESSLIKINEAKVQIIQSIIDEGIENDMSIKSMSHMITNDKRIQTLNQQLINIHQSAIPKTIVFNNKVIY